MAKSSESRRELPWTVDVEKVRRAAVSVASNADKAEFLAAAIREGAGAIEAELISELLSLRARDARGGL